MTVKRKKFGPRLTVSLTESNYDVLAILAEKGDVSVSWVVRRAIEEYLESHRHEVEQELPVRVFRKPQASARLIAGQKVNE